MKKFLLFLLVIFLLTATGITLLFYKSFDEESFREQIVVSTKKLTGCDVVIAGEMKVKLFPSPTITLKDVVVKNKATVQKSDDFMKINSVEARIKFTSLFKNPLVVDNIVFNSPEVFLRRNKTGENNWNFSFFNTATINKDALLGESFVDAPPQFQNIEIKNGTISYQNELVGTDYSLTNIDGKITSKAITGPFDFNGTAKKDNMPLNISLFIGKIGTTFQTDFKLSLSNPNSKAILSIRDGKIEKLGSIDQTLLGSFTFGIPKLSDFLLEKEGYKGLPESMNKNVSGNGKFRMTNKLLSFNDVALLYGNDTKDATQNTSENAAVIDASFMYPTKEGEKTKLSLQVRSTSLNLDTFVPYIPKQPSWQKALEKVVGFLPENMDIVLSANQVKLFEQYIKSFSLSAARQNNLITLREIKANMPEESLLKINGTIEFKEYPLVKLDYSLQTKAIQKTLDWLKIKEIPIRVGGINELDIAGQLQLRPQDLTLGNIDMTINNGNIKGGAVFALTEPDLTGYANLNLSKVNIDDFIPYETPTQEKSFMEWLQSAKAGLEKSALLSDVNMSLTLSGQDITFKSLPIEQFSYEGKIENKTWRTDSLKVSQIAMSNIDYKGTIQKLPDNSLQFKDVQIDLEMPKSLLLLNRLKIKSPLTSNNSKVYLKTNISGSFDKMNIASDISFTQGRIYLKGTIEKILMANPNYALLVKISHPNFQQFMHLFGIEFNQFPSLNGNFSLEGNIKGVPQQLSFANTDVIIGSQRLQGDMDLTKTENGISAKGNIRSPYLYFDKFISTNSLVEETKKGRTKFSGNLIKFDGIDDLSLDIQLSAEKASLGKMELSLLDSHILLSEKMLILDKTKADLNGGSMELSSSLNYGTATPFLKGSLKLDKVPLRADLISLGMIRLKSGLVSSMMDFNTRGNSLDDMMHELSGTGRFTIKNGTISSLNLPAFERRVRSTMTRSDTLDNLIGQLNRETTVGETSFDTLEGSFAITNGVFRTSDTVVRTPDANAMIQLALDIPEWSVNSSWSINFKSFTGYPAVSVIVKGNLYNPQTTFEFASFVNHLKSTANDIKEKLILQEQVKEQERIRKQARERTQSLSRMVETARDQIEKTEKIMQLVETPMAKMEMVRIKDSFVILQELANKQSPSVADSDKAAEKAALIEERTSRILKETTQKAVEAIRVQIRETEKEAQQRMTSIKKIYQRLYSVELVEHAHENSFSAISIIQQLADTADKISDLEKLNEIHKKTQQALNVIEDQYKAIAKFDLDAQVQQDGYEEEPSQQIGGLIRRD